jgi:hypothetical protein
MAQCLIQYGDKLTFTVYIIHLSRWHPKIAKIKSNPFTLVYGGELLCLDARIWRAPGSLYVDCTDSLGSDMRPVPNTNCMQVVRLGHKCTMYFNFRIQFTSIFTSKML